MTNDDAGTANTYFSGCHVCADGWKVGAARGVASWCAECGRRKGSYIWWMYKKTEKRD